MKNNLFKFELMWYNICGIWDFMPNNQLKFIKTSHKIPKMDVSLKK